MFALELLLHRRGTGTIAPNDKGQEEPSTIHTCTPLRGSIEQQVSSHPITGADCQKHLCLGNAVAGRPTTVTRHHAGLAACKTPFGSPTAGPRMDIVSWRPTEGCPIPATRGIPIRIGPDLDATPTTETPALPTPTPTTSYSLHGLFLEPRTSLPGSLGRRPMWTTRDRQRRHNRNQCA